MYTYVRMSACIYAMNCRYNVFTVAFIVYFAAITWHHYDFNTKKKKKNQEKKPEKKNRKTKTETEKWKKFKLYSTEVKQKEMTKTKAKYNAGVYWIRVYWNETTRFLTIFPPLVVALASMSTYMQCVFVHLYACMNALLAASSIKHSNNFINYAFYAITFIQRLYNTRTWRLMYIRTRTRTCVCLFHFSIAVALLREFQRKPPTAMTANTHTHTFPCVCVCCNLDAKFI